MPPRKRPPPPATAAFKPGDAVEITSDEEGFIGAWFEAHILHRRPHTITYDHLVDADDESKPLQETVHPDHIRPRPPPFAGNGGFQIHQMVDVFDNDAWWVGAVVEVKEGGRYRVKFAVEEGEYGEKEIRPHMDWVDGKWVVPELKVVVSEGSKMQVDASQNFKSKVPKSKVVPEPAVVELQVPELEAVGSDVTEAEVLEEPTLEVAKARTPKSKAHKLKAAKPKVAESEVLESKEAKLEVVKSKTPKSKVSKLKVPKMEIAKPSESQGMGFTKGTKVEVSSDEEGLRGAWYTGTIIEEVGGKYLVEYEQLRADDDTELLKETIELPYIRPTPPATPVNENFKVLEEVDVLYNDGWWVGVISKVLSPSRYNVYFKTSQEEMEVERPELRLHYEWVDGTWLRASQALTSDI